MLAALALTACSARDPPERLRELMASADWRDRAYAVQAFRPADLTEEDRRRLRAAARDSAFPVRREAVQKLGAARDVDSLDLLSRILSGEESERGVRSGAAFALGMLDVPGSADPLLRCEEDDARGVRDACRAALDRLAVRQDLAARLTAEASSADAAARGVAVRRLAALRSPAHRGLFERVLLEDSEEIIRAEAARALDRQNALVAADVLARALKDRSPKVRAAAFRLVETEELRTEVEAGLEDSDLTVARAAAKARARITGTPGSADPFTYSALELTDHLALDAAGRLELTRTVTLAVAKTAHPVTEMHLLLPLRTKAVLSARAGGVPMNVKTHRAAGTRLEACFDALPAARAGDKRVLSVTLELEPGLDEGRDGERVLEYRPGEIAAVPLSSRLIVREPSGTHDLEWRDTDLSLSAGAFTAEAPRASSPLPAEDWRRAGLIAGGLAIAALWVARRAWRRGADDVLLITFALWGSIALFHPHLVEDNLNYVAYAKSLVLDGDLHVYDEYFLENTDAIYAPDARQPYGPMGAVFFWYPLFLAGHAAALALAKLGAPWPANGMSLPYLVVLQLGAVALVTFAWLLAYRMARRRFSRFASLAGVLSVAFGTGTLLIQYAWTGSTHAPAVLLATIYLYLLDRDRGRFDSAGGLVLGLVAGLLAQTRVQTAGLLPLAPIVLLWQLRSKADRARVPGALGAFAIGAVLGYAGQPAVSWALDRSLFADLHGLGRGRFAAVFARLGPLFYGGRPSATFHDTGLFDVMPVLYAAGLGLILAARKDPFLIALFALAVLSQLAAVISYPIWWGRMLFAPPYLDLLFPIGAFGAAAALDFVEGLWPREPLRIRGCREAAERIFPPLPLEGVGGWIPRIREGTAGRPSSGRDGLPSPPGPTLGRSAVPSRILRIALALALVLLALPNVRVAVLENADRASSAPVSRTPFLQLAHAAIFLPDNAVRPSYIERRGSFALPLRSMAEALRLRRPGELLAWLAAYAAAGFLLALAANTLARLARRPRVAGAVLASLSGGFAALVLAYGLRTNLEYDYEEQANTRDSYEIQPVLVAAAGREGRSVLKTAFPASSVSVVTFSRETLEVPAGAAVARLTVELADGRHLAKDLRAGLETADLEVQNPSVRPEHGAGAEPVQERTIRDHARETYPAHAYLTRVPISPPAPVDSIAVEYLAPRGELWLTNLVALEDAPAPPWWTRRSGRWRAP